MAAPKWNPQLQLAVDAAVAQAKMDQEAKAKKDAAKSDPVVLAKKALDDAQAKFVAAYSLPVTAGEGRTDTATLIKLRNQNLQSTGALVKQAQASLDAAVRAKSGVDNPVKHKDPGLMKINLPPHPWSLPVRPIQVDSDHTRQSGTAYEVLAGGKVNSADASKGNFGANTIDHSTRRAIMWFYGGGNQVANNNAGTIQYAYNYGLPDAVGTTTVLANVGTPQKGTAQRQQELTVTTDVLDNLYGFQFLWNPENISVSVDRNMDITPSAADRFTTVAGVFPGQESLTFTIILDRTNDFAAAKALGTKDYAALEKYYSSNMYPGTSLFAQNKYYGNRLFVEEIKDLMERGTAYDVEYLFKTVNGQGVIKADGQQEWHNLLDRPTADLSYLQPSIVAVQFGPNTKSLSYVGWITNLQISHLAFTEDMIPLRTTVQVNMAILSGSSMGPQKS